MDGILVLCMTNPKTPKGKCAELEGIHQWYAKASWRLRSWNYNQSIPNAMS
jgi:hypothetical protein